MDGAARLVAPVLQHLRAAADEPRRSYPRGSTYARRPGCVRGGRAVIRARAVPGLGRIEGPVRQRRGALVPDPENGPRHGRGSPPAPPAHAWTLVARRTRHDASLDSAGDLRTLVRESHAFTPALDRLGGDWCARLAVRWSCP